VLRLSRFFGSDTVVVRIAELIIQRLLVKIRQIWEIKINRKRNYRVDKGFGYKLFVTIIHPRILRLHWWHLI
jgi:hypothetical protein